MDKNVADESFSDWETLVNAVDAKISGILMDDVSPVAEKILKEHIKADIYEAYTPKENGWVNDETYKRRHILETSITTILQNKNTILITGTSAASPSVVKGWSFHNRYPGSFLKLIEVGNMGIWHNGFPRPVVTNAQNEIDNSQKIKSAIKNGIRREIGNTFNI